MRRFVTLAGGSGKALIAVVPMASRGGAGDGARAGGRAGFSLGARGYVLLVDKTQAGKRFGGQRPRLGHRHLVQLAAIRQSHRGRMGGTATQRAMQARYRAGAVVGGTSAGAAIMSDSMITGNQTPPGDTTGYYGDEYPAISRHRIEITPGLGFLPNAIVDQHFIKRERHNRLISAVLEHPGLVGVGIDESTALEVRPDGPWRVLGESAVVIYDARKAHVTKRLGPDAGRHETCAFTCCRRAARSIPRTAGQRSPENSTATSASSGGEHMHRFRLVLSILACFAAGTTSLLGPDGDRPGNRERLRKPGAPAGSVGQPGRNLASHPDQRKRAIHAGRSSGGTRLPSASR